MYVCNNDHGWICAKKGRSRVKLQLIVNHRRFVPWKEGKVAIRRNVRKVRL